MAHFENVYMSLFDFVHVSALTAKHFRLVSVRGPYNILFSEQRLLVQFYEIRQGKEGKKEEKLSIKDRNNESLFVCLFCPYVCQ